jgi:3''-deamino-3''-oxonicotianamine reductase
MIISPDLLKFNPYCGPYIFGRHPHLSPEYYHRFFITNHFGFVLFIYKLGFEEVLCRFHMHILNFCSATVVYTSPATPKKQREAHKRHAMASPMGSISIRHSRIPEFIVGPIAKPVPAVGLGTAFHPFVAEDVRAAVLSALELGYRHIDTAALYASERVVGEAMAEAVQCGIVASREELFVTSKVWCTQCHPELVLPSLRESLL